MNLFDNLDKNNLHHAYLIEGKKEELIPEVLLFMKEIGVEIHNNQDFIQITQDSFKRDDAKNLKSRSIEKGLSENKKVFVISVNNFLIDAQNTLLKMFEEPIENTIFFLIVPDVSILLPTVLSRFYLIKTEKFSAEGGSASGRKNELKEAEEFLKMSLNSRINFIKDLVKKPDEEDESDLSDVVIDSTRSKTIKFLNALEKILHQRLLSKNNLDHEVDYFYQILKVREYLSQPGSSAKSLMESVALVIPKL